MRASLYDAGKPGKQDVATVQATTMLTILPGTTITLRTWPSPMNFATCGSASAAASIASRGQSGAPQLVPRRLPLTWTASVTRCRPSAAGPGRDGTSLGQGEGGSDR